jgi:hypothetical protein
MLIWVLSQKDVIRYDTYSSAVVVANDEKSAKSIHPDGNCLWDYALGCWRFSNGEIKEWEDETWVAPDKISAKMIGIAHGDTSKRVICSSINLT